MNALQVALKATDSDIVHTIDGVLHKEKKGFVIVAHKEKEEHKDGEEVEEVYARLHDPANTPQIKDPSDEEEVARAIAKIVKEIVEKARKLYEKHLEELKKKVGDVKDDGK